MRIKEVSAATKLTERAIRLYEEHGLISPAVTDKNGRDFRDYSDTDVKKLKTIASLRRALFTIDEIKRMFSDPETIVPTVASHRELMHTDFEKLSYLVERIDAVDEALITSAHGLANAIFATDGKDDTDEKEKLLYSEQYESIYKKYFAENTGWEKRYSFSLAVEWLFSKKQLAAKLAVLAAAVLFVLVGFVFHGSEPLDYRMEGYIFRTDDANAVCSLDELDEKDAIELRITCEIKHYLLREDVIEGYISLDNYWIGNSMDTVVYEFKEPFSVKLSDCRERQILISADEIDTTYENCVLYARRITDNRGAFYGMSNAYACFDENLLLRGMTMMMIHSGGSSETWGEDDLCAVFYFPRDKARTLAVYREYLDSNAFTK